MSRTVTEREWNAMSAEDKAAQEREWKRDEERIAASKKMWRDLDNENAQFRKMQDARDAREELATVAAAAWIIGD